MTDPVPDLAAEISPDDAPPVMQMRVGLVTAVEVSGSRRVQLDIGGDAWINRVQDTLIRLNDRVSVLQQGSVMLVVGRLEGTDGFVPVGAILPWAGFFAPANYVYCDGTAVPRTQYPELFYVIGTVYGAGNGSTTFNVPDLRGKFPQGEGGGVGFFRGNTGGGYSSSVSLSSSNMPSHNHSISGSADSSGSHGHSLSGSVGFTGDHSHGVGNQSTRSDILSSGGSTTAATGGGSTGGAGGHSHSMSGSADSAGSHSHSLSGTSGSSGSGSAFNVTTTPPFLTVGYIIRAL